MIFIGKANIAVLHQPFEPLWYIAPTPGGTEDDLFETDFLGERYRFRIVLDNRVLGMRKGAHGQSDVREILSAPMT